MQTAIARGTAATWLLDHFTCFGQCMNHEITRRQALLGAFAAGTVALVGCGETSAPPQARAHNTIDDDVATLEQRYGARIGLWASDLTSGAIASYRPRESFAMCSTFKPYAVAVALQFASRGWLNLDDAVPVSAADIVVNSPVLSTLIGGSITLSQACDAALTRSDNTAGNILLRAIGGPPAITAFARSVGDARTQLDRWEPDLNEALPGDLRDTTTPESLAAGYRAILTGDTLEQPHRERLVGWMRATRTSDERFRAGLPQGWSSADKTGAGYYGSTNDAGLLFGPSGQQILVAVLTRSHDDRQDASPFNEAIADTVRLTLTNFGHT